MLLQRFEVKLIGFFGSVPIYRQTLKAVDRAHAFRIASATFNNCFSRSEIKLVEPCVWYKH